MLMIPIPWVLFKWGGEVRSWSRFALPEAYPKSGGVPVATLFLKFSVHYKGTKYALEDRTKERTFAFWAYINSQGLRVFGAFVPVTHGRKYVIGYR